MTNTILLALLFTQPPSEDNKFTVDATISGEWTVVSYEKDGVPVLGVKDAKVSIKDNVATFTAAAGSDKGQMKAMRFSFGPNATIRATEANADGKFDAAATQPATATTTPVVAGQKSGVYVLTQDYLAVSIHDDSARTVVSAAGDVRPAGGASTDASKPNAKTYCTVILKRSSGK